MIDLNNFNARAYMESERIAHMQGDTEKAALIARIIELANEKEEQKKEIEGLQGSISDFEDILNQIRDII